MNIRLPDCPEGDIETESLTLDRGVASIETQRIVAATAALLTAAAGRAIHAQWQALSGESPADASSRAIVDPEALLLFSLWLLPRDGRLHALVHDWVARWSDLLSVQRTRNIARGFGADVQQELRAVATTALDKGKDFRWSPVIRGGAPSSRAGALEDVGQAADGDAARQDRLPVSRAALLVLRFRMAFGVGARADALAYLLARGSAWSTVTEISQATGYTPSAIRRALDRMAEADIVLVVDDGTTRYRCDAAGWTALLGLRTEVAPWQYWLQHFTFVATFVEWAEGVAKRKLTAYAITEGLRGVARTFRPTDDRDALRAWDHAFRDGSSLDEMEAALAGVARTFSLADPGLSPS